jgi:hypothetical protein
MENEIIFPIIIIILGFCYFGSTMFLYKKKLVPFGLPTIPFFWMFKKDKNLGYFWFFILFSIVFSIGIIGLGISWLIEVI